ncbi:MAG: trypsin-like peptidase domain-containing protein [Actinomycetota bacterium]|nr:trypsin-like peptidase domain-containing protein [Actinomycetota bacterium]
MLVVDLILGAVIALLVIWGFSRGVTVSTLALAGFGAGAVLGSRLAPLTLSGGLHSAYAPEVAIPGALLVGALSAALFERLGLRMRRRLGRLGLTSPIGGALLGGVLGLMVVWILGVVAIQVGSLRGDVRRSAILSRLDALLTPPGPPLTPRLVYSDPFPTFRGPSPAAGPLNSLVTRTPGVRLASRSVMKIEVLYCNTSKSGTGWIAADGVVATNAHVVAAEQIAAARFRGTGRSYPATPIWFDPKNDIALLRVPGVRGMHALPMVADPRAGTEAATLGFPFGHWADRPSLLGATNSMYSGQLSARINLPREFSHELFGRPITGFSGRSEPGNSGSPVVDRRGHVLATVFAGGSESGLAVPNRLVRYALRHAGPQVGTGPCPPGSSS